MLIRTHVLPLAAVMGMVTALGAQQAPAPPAPSTPNSGVPTSPVSGAPVTVPGVPAPTAPRPAAVAAPAVPEGVTPPPDYVIGPGDVLGIVFWREPDMTADVMVRPDGRISIPLLNDVTVAGLTPQQLQQKLAVDAQRYVQDPNVTVVTKQINSRRVFITGQVGKPGPYPLIGPMNVLQFIATAGGLNEYADSKKITIMRMENGKTRTYPFNYKEVSRGRSLAQNIDLKPGDTVIVP